MDVDLGLDGVRARRDASSGEWTIECGGETRSLRAWTWGERRRLVEGAWTSTGFDRERFVQSVLPLVLDRPPPPEEGPLWAWIALELFDGPRTLGHALGDDEAFLARELRWGPRSLDSEPAPEFDRLVRHLRSAAGPTADDGWNRIVVTGDD